MPEQRSITNTVSGLIASASSTLAASQNGVVDRFSTVEHLPAGVLGFAAVRLERRRHGQDDFSHIQIP
jgi:hypothetical protein